MVAIGEAEANNDVDVIVPPYRYGSVAPLVMAQATMVRVNGFGGLRLRTPGPRNPSHLDLWASTLDQYFRFLSKGYPPVAIDLAREIVIRRD